MQWTYILRNRARWAALPVTVKKQADRARRDLGEFGVTPAHLEAIAKDRIVEVVIPFTQESKNWEARIFPWEYTLASATRDARHGEPLTVVRRLVVHRKDTAPPKPRKETPVKVLYVESAPGKLRDLYEFDTERALVKSNLRLSDWHELITPTLETLRDKIRGIRPDVIHLAGFDSHQGRRLLWPTIDDRNAATESPPRTQTERDDARDGYLLVTASGEPDPIDAQTLAKALCADGHRPLLVSLSFHNSAARIAPMTIAEGANAAIGFQDVFDDNLAEIFFGSFYRAWRKSGWRLTEAFRAAWEAVRAQPTPVTGSGLVLWGGQPLLKTAIPVTAVSSRPVSAVAFWLPGDVPAEHQHKIITPHIEAVSELNYALLHNRCPLFPRFTLLNKSADYKNKDQLATLGDLDVKVTLSAGQESATYEQRLELTGPSLDIGKDIHVPLTSDLLRSVHESINSSLLVEVSWGKVIYRNSLPLRLLPVDQWRDNDKDGQWLPSFVLPRDPAVTGLVEKAQRYVRVLRDDPSAGFDGYQSLDSQAAEPAAEIDRQVQAIWATIVHELDLGYINPPPSYNSAMDSQRMRTPSMIAQDRSGTCIDLALLLAACCELIDVYPVIFLLKDHAFPGYWRDPEFQEKFIELSDDFVTELSKEEEHKTSAPGAQRVPWWFRDTAYGEIVRQVKLGNLVPLESVWLTAHSGFWDAVDGGKDNLKKPSRFHSMLDIARAREAGVTPLPLSVRP